MIKAAVLMVVALFCGYWLFGNTDVVFRSSDGGWADSEIQFKGRDFKSIVWHFEAYKLQCARPTAKLFRATSQHWYNPFVWPSYLSSPKWRVPYSDAHPEVGDYYPPASADSCANQGISPEMSNAADLNAARYLATLN